MRTTQYIHGFEFAEGDTYTFADADRLTARSGAVTLRRQRRTVSLPGRSIEHFPVADAAVSPTNLDLYVRTAAYAPGALVSWGFVQLVGDEPRNELLDDSANPVGRFDLRLHDGTDSRYWDGAAWSIVATPDDDWNTLADFNANLSTYTGASLAVEVRLRSLDENYTPTLRCVLLRWEGRTVNVFQEWIFETVVAMLKDGLRPLTDLTLSSPGTLTIDLSTYTFDNLPTLTGVTQVFDHTADPGHVTDLFSSYAAGVVTLTAPIPAANIVYLTAEYVPDVAVTTSSCYPLEAKVPAVWITDIRQTGKSRGLGATGPAIIDESLDPPAGTVYPEAIKLVDLDFVAALVAPRALDLTQLAATLDGWFEAHPTLRSPAFDEPVALEDGQVLAWATGIADVDDARASTATWRIRNIPIVGDNLASGADANASGRTGPVTAGDPSAPGVGYGVGTFNLRFRTDPDGGDETFTIPE